MAPLNKNLISAFAGPFTAFIIFFVFILIFITATPLFSFPCFAENSNDSEDSNDIESIFEEWVKEGESFTVKGKTYLVSAGETTRSAILMGPDGVFVVEEKECVNIKDLRFCMEKFKYTIGGNITIHGRDIQQFYIVVYEPGPDVRIEMDATETDIMVGESTTITLLVKNIGDEPALGIELKASVPEQFEITDSYDLEEYGNEVFWRGSMPADSEREFSYTIKAKSRFRGSLNSSLLFKYRNKTYTKKEGIVIKANALFNVDVVAEKQNMEIGEEKRFYVYTSSNKTGKTSFNLKVEVPYEIIIQQTHFNISRGNIYEWNGSLEEGESKNFTTKFKANGAGNFSIKAALTDLSDKSNPAVEYANISIKKAEPSIYFVYANISIGENSTIKVYMRNPNKYAALKDINIYFESPYANKTGYIATFSPMQYDNILTASFVPLDKKFNVKIAITYRLAGVKYNITKEEEILTEAEKEEEKGEKEEVNFTSEEATPEQKIERQSLIESINKKIETANTIQYIVNLFQKIRKFDFFNIQRFIFNTGETEKNGNNSNNKGENKNQSEPSKI
ncbi:MAG: hypothetical protein N3D84_00805 [Candidatus Woesearchaeota archaeon]|nr:hypothetical protein [Candidatus Woesearchaeota archaeon]